MAYDDSRTDRIDERILSLVGERFKKVVLIITLVANEMGADWQEDNGLKQIAQRIGALVRDGRLVAQGDVGNWRHCEVRRPGPQDHTSEGPNGPPTM